MNCRSSRDLPAVHFIHGGRLLRGAHLKVWHYHEHLRGSGRFDTSVWLAPGSMVSPESPWAAPSARWLTKWAPETANALFINGKDWRHVPVTCTVPVLNLVQSMRHTHPDDERYGYLHRRAFRIAISEEIAEALAASGVVNGPVITIPVATDLEPIANLPTWTTTKRPVDVVIAGRKNPALAEVLVTQLRGEGCRVISVTDYVPRSEFLALFRCARVAITLPTHAEGFFLVPMEAMAHGCIPICPAVPGTMPYSKRSAVPRPPYERDAIIAATLRTLALDPASVAKMVDAGAEFVREHSLETERQQVLEVLDDFETFCASG